MKVETIKNDIRIEYYESMGEFIRKAQTNPTPQSSNGNSADWAGTATLSDACDLALHGWDEVRGEVDAIMADLTERIADRMGERYVTTHSVTGGGIDVGRYLSGHPACMIQFVPVASEAMGRVVKVVVAGTASSSIPAEHIRRRGIAVIALIDTLHKLGLGVELWWESTISGRRGPHGGERYTTAVKVHDSAEPMDVDSIMFAMAHPSMLRRLKFSVQEQSENAQLQGAYMGGGYGTPNSLGLPAIMEFDVRVEKLQDGSGDIINDPFKWVVSTVEGIGVLEEVK